jgi:NAD(P)-dependent dehydrogenase (short-subunit alcohol dehydrogenase family)
MNLRNSVILVTGGAHRVGKSIALALASKKAHIAFTYHSSEEAAVNTKNELELLSGDALSLHCDQSDTEQIRQTVELTLAHYDRLDGLVNSASIMQEKTFFETTNQDWDKTLAINTRGPFFFTQLAAQWMINHQGGSIVNIIDKLAVVPSSRFTHHSASKSALWMLTQSCALALAPTVRVNAVLSGPVLKPESWAEERWQALVANVPLKKMGSPQDVARAVIYLMEEDYITGQVIAVDGGSTIR